MARTQEQVAVLGIGAMGHGMATSALRAGIPTMVWNREPEATRFESRGVVYGGPGLMGRGST